MNAATYTLLRNVENEFSVPLTARMVREPQCLAEVFLAVWHGLAKQHRIKPPTYVSDSDIDDGGDLGQSWGGRLPGFWIKDPALRGHPRDPFIASADTPGQPIQLWLYLTQPPGGAVAQAKKLAARFGSIGHNHPIEARAVYSHFLLLASRTYRLGRHALHAKIFDPLSDLGEATEVLGLPRGDTVFVEPRGQIDASQRKRLVEAIVGLMRGELDWSQANRVFLKIDDVNEPILYELSCTLSAIHSSLATAAWHKPLGLGWIDFLLDLWRNKRQVAETKALQASPALADRRSILPATWDFLQHLLVALVTPLPLCVVTFLYPSTNTVPQQCSWRPLWTQEEYDRHAQLLAAFDIPKYEDIDALCRPVSPLEASWQRFLKQPQKLKYPRFIMAQTRDVPVV